MSNPSNVKYLIGTSVGGYSADTLNYIQQWENKCSEIGVTVVNSGENIYFYGDLNTNNGLYALTKSRNDYAVITYQQLFTTLTTSQQRETIVHEVGHALGLEHCQASKNSISVMRGSGFNGKAYPLSDDIAGISALY